MTVVECNTDEEFRDKMVTYESKTVVVDFTATWCGPCKMMASPFEQLSVKHPSLIFLKVDVDKCQETSSSNDIKALPTFKIFIKGNLVETMEAANPMKLIDMCEKYDDQYDEQAM